jgi:hypothetical protein
LSLPNSSLSIDCRIRNGRIEAVEIGPRFLPPLAPLLRGKTPAEALARASALFALCRHGQCLALSRAIGHALDVPAAKDWSRLLRALRDVEIVREHSLNLLRLPGWPGSGPSLPVRLLEALGGINRALAGDRSSEVFVPDGGSVALDGKALPSHGQTLWAALDTLLGAGWLEAQPDFETALQNGAWPLDRFLCDLGPDADFGRSAALAPLPVRLPEAGLAAVLRAPAEGDFPSRPVWEGQPHETGCYARRQRLAGLRLVQKLHGHGLASRVFARLLDIRAVAHSLRRRLAHLSAQPVIEKPTPRRSAGFGLGQVQTARGLLIHAVELRDGLIADCRYVAPTEWNFHPEGLLAKALKGLPVQDEKDLRRRIGLFLHSADPCVDFHLTLRRHDS